VALLIAMLEPTCAHAEFWSGSEMMEYCEPGPKLQYSRFYVTGITDALSGNGMFCLPSGATAGQVGDVFCKHLRDNPAERHKAARDLAISVFKSAFPCR
jgi:Rap1a immunity proteins